MLNAARWAVLSILDTVDLGFSHTKMVRRNKIIQAMFRWKRPIDEWNPRKMGKLAQTSTVSRKISELMRFLITGEDQTGFHFYQPKAGFWAYTGHEVTHTGRMNSGKIWAWRACAQCSHWTIYLENMFNNSRKSAHCDHREISTAPTDLLEPVMTCLQPKIMNYA